MASVLRLRQMVYLLSLFALLVGVFMTLPLIVALLYGEQGTLKSFLLPQAGILLLGGLAAWLSHTSERQALPARSGFLLVTLGWLVISLAGSLPFLISGAIPSPVDAFFETMSGFTTTGASILTNIEALPRSLLFWRSFTHWLGGMGIVALTVALFPLLGIGGGQLLRAEVPGPDLTKIADNVTKTAKLLWLVYLGLTVVQTIALMLCGLDLYDSLVHTFGTVATGGFSNHNASVAGLGNPAAEWVITLFMVLAGMNFTLHWLLLLGKFRTVWKNSELRVYLLLLALGTVFITVNLGGDSLNWWDSLRLASFQVASIMTSTGYVTENYALWPAFSQGILFLLMWMGASSGSTGGGVKVVRWMTAFQSSYRELKQLMFPKAVFALRLGGKPVQDSFEKGVLAFLLLYLFLVALGTLVVSASGIDVLSSLTSVLASLGNIGPGFGLVGPIENYAHFSPLIKVFLAFLMLVGRLEVFTVLVLFTPHFWRR